MLDIVRSDQRYSMDAGWLQANWHFSFDSYYDPDNVQFGPLRVFNNDVVQPGKGFPMHPHANMEILTYVFDGALEHRDSTGGHGIIHAGEVQRMSAGRGIVHSEFNASKTDTVELVQIWILPAEKDVEPGYEQVQFSQEQRSGKLLAIASGDGDPGAAKIGQDVKMLVSRLDPGQQVDYAMADSRRAYVFVGSGEVELNGEKLSKGDSVKVTSETKLSFGNGDGAELVVLDLP